MSVRVQEQPFDPGAELNGFSSQIVSAGAVVSFTGIVRDLGGSLDHMEIEHYAAMTQKALEDIKQQADDRWELDGSLIIHRYGKLKPGELIMMVATAARHRVAAFEAAEYLMDFLKSRAPFWKKEVTVSGDKWVAAKPHDEDALKRW